MQRFAVIGLGRFGQRLARALTATGGAEVIAIDREAKPVEAIRDEVALAVRLDGTDEDALRAQGVADVDAAIVGIGEGFEAAALTVAVLHSLGVARIYARAETDIQGQILTRVGADEIVNPEHESALRWAHRLMLPNLRQYVELGQDHAMVYSTAPAAFCHKTLADLQLRRKHGVNLVAIQRHVTVQTEDSPKPVTSSLIVVPQADTTILPDDVLILVGSNEALSQLSRE
ncbi:MAG: TrkA family potassium uptake protein [Planctomycetes bacterium]|nr:TrkA family potassium uptake protein [Planctomycetota bacterium]